MISASPLLFFDRPSFIMTASKMVMPNTWADFDFEFDFVFELPRPPLLLLLLLLPLFPIFCMAVRSIVVTVTASDTNSTSDDDEDDDDDEDSEVGGVSGVICGFISMVCDKKNNFGLQSRMTPKRLLQIA